MPRPGAGFLRPGGAQPLPSPKPSVPLLQAAAAATYTLLLVRLHTTPVIYVRVQLPAMEIIIEKFGFRSRKTRIFDSRYSSLTMYPNIRKMILSFRFPKKKRKEES